MAAPAVIAITILAALAIVMFMAASLMVTLQVHREERHWTLARTAPSRWALLTRSVCGVHIYGMVREPVADLSADEGHSWYEHHSGATWS